MRRSNFNDNVSVLSDDRALFSRSKSRRSSLPSASAATNSSSRSVVSSSASLSPSSSGSPFMRMRKPFRFRGASIRSGIDDVSVSDSLCSGVLRGLVGQSDRSVVASGRTQSDPPALAQSAPPASTPLMPGGVASSDAKYDKKTSEGSSLFNDQFGRSVDSGGTGLSMEAMSVGFAEHLAEDAVRREQRKERVKEKLEKYKRDQKMLRKSCAALEQQLAQTTEKLREVDSRAAFKIDSLESELAETRVGMEKVAKQSTKEVTDQSEVIKTLGKKLIRQAHVIKRQKDAVEEYKVRLEAMAEEMAMQDERDSRREDEFAELSDKYANVKEQKVQMQHMLQENIEEMMDLKAEVERDAKRIMEMELNLQQKEATVDRVAMELSEKSRKISELEDELEEKNHESKGIREKLKDSETSAEITRKELESANDKLRSTSMEAEELKNKLASLKTVESNGVSGGVGLDGNNNTRPNIASHKQPSKLGWRRLGGDMDVETFEDELRAKDATIELLANTNKELEEEMKTLKSDMVKMSSTYKQDSYLKRKEIAKLKQTNAEYALKLRALEKALKTMKATESMAMSGSRHHSHTTHGGGVGGGSPRMGVSGSRHGKSMHSVDSLNSKEDMAKAVKTRLGVLAPYEFPSADQLRMKDSPIVLESNFFDGSDQASEDGRKGEPPEEG